MDKELSPGHAYERPDAVWLSVDGLLEGFDWLDIFEKEQFLERFAREAARFGYEVRT